MKRGKLVETVFVGVMALATILFLGRMFMPGLSLFAVPPEAGLESVAAPAGPLSDLVLLRGAAVIKFLFLALGAFLALRLAVHFGGENPIRPAWLHLGLGLAATTLGQVCLACYQFSPSGNAPFPSVADYFFFLSYPFFILALFSFMQAYDAAGYPLGSRAQRLRLELGLAGAALVAAVVVLWPVVHAPAAAQERFLNIAYPVLDLTLLVPTILLLKASLPLRGGEVWKSWAALLAGFLFMSVGDVLFAYFSALGITKVDPLVHVTFILSYGCLALGVVRQQTLLAS